MWTLRLDPRLLLVLFIVVVLGTFPGCMVVKKLVGADIDPEQYAAAREARMMEVRADNTAKLAQRLKKGPVEQRPDATMHLHESFLQDIARQYVGTRGRLDDATRYTVDSVQVRITEGSALATLALTAVNSRYDVTVQLAMDCILLLDLRDDTLRMRIEPFNIAPVVTAEGLLASADDLIRDLLKVELASLGSSYPPLTIPVNFSNAFTLKSSSLSVRQQINLDVDISERKVTWGIKLTELLFLNHSAWLTFSLDYVEVQ